MERALLVLAVSSLLILSSVEATTKPQACGVVTEINNNLNKIKSEAQLAVATFDRLAQDASRKTNQATWIKECNEKYKHVILQANKPVTSLEKALGNLRIDLNAILKDLERCDQVTRDLPGGLMNPAKTYEYSIRDLTLKTISLAEGSGVKQAN